MNFEADTKMLQNALARLVRLTRKANNTLPALKTVRVDAGANLRLTATNLSMSLTITLPAQVHETGGVCLYAERLSNWLRWSAAETLHFSPSTDDGAVIVDEQDGGRLRLTALDITEFPGCGYTPLTETAIQIDALALRNLLRRTVICASRDDARPLLQAVRLEYTPGTLTAVACDGFRIAEWSTPLEGGPQEPCSWVVPQDAVNALLGYFPLRPGQPVTIRKVRGSEYLLMFSVPGYELVTQLIEGNFPNYRAIMPAKFKYEVVFARNDLIRVLQQCGVVLGKEFKPVTFTFEGQAAEIAAKSEEHGAYSRLVAFTGEPFNLRLACNLWMLLAIVQSIPEPTITLKINDSKSPALFTGERYNCLLMPMHLG
jgi:DNA polymerase-3 subunit beta